MDPKNNPCNTGNGIRIHIPETGEPFAGLRILITGLKTTAFPSLITKTA